MEKQIMKKDVHIYLEYDLSNIIEKIAKQNNESLSTTYSVLLKNALYINEILSKLDLIYNLLLKNENKRISKRDKISD